MQEGEGGDYVRQEAEASSILLLVPFNIDGDTMWHMVNILTRTTVYVCLSARRC